jgi:hypothetical protein
MENGVDDRLWDKEIQQFIEACKNGKLGSILLGYTVMDDGRKILNVQATYSSRQGPVRIGYRWAQSRRLGWLPVVFVGERAAAAVHQVRALRVLAWQSGLWRERRDLTAALLAVTQVFFRAQMVRAGLDEEHVKLLADAGPESERVQDMTLQTLNDLAFLYSG